MNFPSISVIIPTYRREEPLKDTLDDLLKQDYPDFEVLVIDQTATHSPEIQSYLENLANQHKISWYRLDWASLPGARNYGVRRTQAISFFLSMMMCGYRIIISKHIVRILSRTLR